MSRVRELVPTGLQPAVRTAFRHIGPPTARFRMQPQFIVIGGQRCGTTSIFKALAEHPQVVRPPVDKGTDYYTLHYTRGLDWYRGHFPVRSLAQLRSTRSGPPVAFEACTYYMFHPFALQRLAADFPDMKLVAMLRNPVERAFSAYKHEFARGFETVADFEEALDLEPERLRGEVELMGRNPDYESLAHRHHAYTSRGEYAVQLRRAMEYFPREQLHVLESEDFFDRPESVYAQLLEFLGLREFAPKRFDRFNARPSSPMPEKVLHRLHEHYRPHDSALADFLGRTPRWLEQ